MEFVRVQKDIFGSMKLSYNNLNYIIQIIIALMLTIFSYPESNQSFENNAYMKICFKVSSDNHYTIGEVVYLTHIQEGCTERDSNPRQTRS